MRSLCLAFKEVRGSCLRWRECFAQCVAMALHYPVRPGRSQYRCMFTNCMNKLFSNIIFWILNAEVLTSSNARYNPRHRHGTFNTVKAL